MIPPITPGQSEVNQNVVAWKNTFNMRQITLLNLTATALGLRNGAKSSALSHRIAYSVISAPKSLDILRQNLQTAINKDIDSVIKKYVDKFFQPAVANIKNNLGPESVSEENMREVCRQILEEAKSMYAISGRFRDRIPYQCSQSEADSESNIVPEMSTSNKRKDLELEHSEISGFPVAKRLSKPKTISNYYNDNLGCKFSLKRDGPKWNPERIKPDTLFIMGSRANKVLGYGQTRGRLYVRHPNLLRYCGDQEDKEWLQSQNLLPANGGKIYIMLLEDIKELTESDEYRNNPNLQLHELQGFEAPDFMNAKIKNFLEYIKSEKKLMAVLDIDDNSVEAPLNENEKNLWRTSQLRQQIDYPNMSSDMSSLSSSVISSILAGTYSPVNKHNVDNGPQK
ncbi:hypothetical protein ABEB36_007100 [Hypothenemus hampei]|uniref:Deoxynucleotidyltransferase terminal-interacting protein 1 n=2 Tax=Hypothenemus hampei TaxID=57062 RepID=A0ABD1EV29_HYPHA